MILDSKSFPLIMVLCFISKQSYSNGSIGKNFACFKQGITDRMKYLLPNKWLELQI